MALIQLPVHQLKLFLEVVEEGSFPDALIADNCHVLQGVTIEELENPLEFAFPSEKVAGLGDGIACDEG